MVKKALFAVLALFVMLALFGLVFSQATGESSADVSAQLEKVETYKWYPAQAEAIYQEITRDYPGSDYALTAHKNLIISYRSAKRDGDAQMRLNELGADFSGHPGLPTALYDIARIYERSRKYEDANSIYQQIIQQYPESLSAGKAQLAGPRIAVLSCIELKDEIAAVVAMSSLIADFNDNPELPLSLYDIARRYERAKKYEKAASLYQQIIQQYAESSAADRAELAVERTDIYSLIESEEPNAVQTAIDGLIADYPNHQDMSEALYDIAGRYEKAKNYEQAKSIYQQVIQRYPDSSHAARAKIIIPKMDIFSLIESSNYSAAGAGVDKLTADFAGHSHLAAALKAIARRYEKAEQYEETESINQQIAYQYSASLYGGSAEIKIPTNRIVQLIDAGQAEEAQTATDGLIVDFNDHPALPEALARIAGRYYRKASFLLMESNNEPNDQFRSCLQKAAAMYEMLTEQFPVTSSTAERHRLAGDCYRKLGQYEKAIEYYQKVIGDYSGYQLAGHAWFFIGRCLEALRESGALSEEEAELQIEQAYRTIVEEYPNYKRFGYACEELGWLNFGKGQWDRAAEYFELYLSRYPDSKKTAHILYVLGRAYEQMGQLDEAAEAYSEFITTADPNDSRIETVRAWLEDRRTN